MRFDSARAAGLTEDAVEQIVDGYEQKLGPRQAAALKLTDAIISPAPGLDEAALAELRARFDDAEIAEMALGVGLFHGMSKVLICLGLEPQEMDLTILKTPGSP
ncbi:MAG: hypothetical protein RIC56_10650 [Pseudomonadales bacterium]